LIVRGAGSIVAGLAGLVIAAVGGAACAQTETATAGSSVVLQLTVRASVSVSCGFTPGAAPPSSTSVGSVTQTFSQTLTFTLRCNTPSRVAIVSDNGGLLGAVSGAAAPGYSKLAPYQVQLNLVGDGGVSASATCTADKLTATAVGCPFQGSSSSTKGLLLNAMSTDAAGSFLQIGNAGLSPTGILLASSSYADRLTITISPAS
jgi:hypothetical protein